jgi:aminopeptidase N
MKHLYLLLSALFFTVVGLEAQPVQFSKKHGCHFYRNQGEAAKGPIGSTAAFNGDPNARSDTFDILHYDITIDLSEASSNILNGNTGLTFVSKMDGLTGITLDLEGLTVSTCYNDTSSLNFSHPGTRFLLVEFPEPMNEGDTSTVFVTYRGNPITNQSGFGGFYFEENYAYNLSIGIQADPHNYGRAWYPCFDNFQDRATYKFQVITGTSQSVYCSGDYVEEMPVGTDKKMTVYEQNIPIPTYLASMAAANYELVTWDYNGLFRDIPVRIAVKNRDLGTINDPNNSFAKLDDAIRTFEEWYGDMPWTEVGYTMATRGAMENPNNIIYPDFNIENNLDHKPLMSHELAHQWWGNIVNPKTSMDMWIKEGNAEYGFHLFYEKLYGKDEFELQVGTNILEVLKTAHVTDSSYYALSPMPKNRTYGNHTYYKGASMIHNMRTYLGDSLFEAGQKAVLNNYWLGPLDAYEYRDQLTQTTGVDMTDFFQNNIFSPGFTDFEIDSVKVIQNNGQYIASVFIQQKLRAAPEFFKNVPVFINFLDDNLEEHIFRYNMNGEFATAIFALPFAPKFTFLNTHQEINMAQLNDTRWISKKGGNNFRNTSFNITLAEDLQDSVFLHVEHHWTGPDKPDPNSNMFTGRISENHYWSVKGTLDAPLDVNILLNYDGTDQSGYLDADLTEFTEDSLVLVYRQRPGMPWREYSDYRKTALSPVDKKGFIRIDKLRTGEYAFANGEFLLVNAEEPVVKDFYSKVYPNPVSDIIQIEGYYEDLESRKVTMQLSDAAGKVVKHIIIPLNVGLFKENIDIATLEKGMYFYQLISESGERLNNGKLVKI